MYRRHFLLFAGISALLAIPSAASSGFNVFAVFGSLFQPTAQFNDTTYIESQLAQIVALIINLALLPFGLGAVTYAACESALGRRETGRALFLAGLGRYFSPPGFFLFVLGLDLFFHSFPTWVLVHVYLFTGLP